MRALFQADTEAAQMALGRRLAALCPARFVIYLKGDLGAGKTTLARGFLRGLGYQGAVKSPTYTLLEPYRLSSGRSCFHLDLYRLADPEELEYLGIWELWQQDAVLLIEWPEQGQGELPEADLVVRIRFEGEGRKLEMDASTDAGVALLTRLGQVEEPAAETPTRNP